jgi:RNA polymerase sigma factor (sigma-70 family)
MAHTASESISRHLESLFQGSSVAGLSDRQLLDRFTAARDPAGEAAFAALVARHGPMVLNICRQLLGDHHHAEDSFQAVFLVLARRAPSIRDPDLLGNWLYGVALRTASCAKQQLDRRRKKEEGDAVNHPGPGPSAETEPIFEPADQTILDREQAEAIHREIDRLPKSFRLPVVLCYFEGLTLDEAARRLRCPAGTLRSRLARARDKLRRALTRRGALVPAGAIATVLNSRAANASVSSSLCEITTRTAIEFLGGTIVSSAATDLSQRALRLIVVSRTRFTALSLLILAACAASAGFLAHTFPRRDETRMATAARQEPVAAKSDDLNRKAAPGRMFVVGRVLDPQGRPVPGATVAASARGKLSWRALGMEGNFPVVIGHANADGSGRFRLDAARTSSTRNDEFRALALAPGFGVGWADLDPDADQPVAEISLQPEQVIKGRLLDLQGRPAQGVAVSVSTIERVQGTGKSLRGELDGAFYWSQRVNELPAWPKPATTDADGRFEVHGVGRRLLTRVDIIDPRYALQATEIRTDDVPGAKFVAIAVQPAKVFTGRVTYADSGKPVPRATVHIGAGAAGQRGFRTTRSQTDDNGRFRANPSAGDLFHVSAFPPSGQLYLTASKRVEWPKGAVEQSVDLALPPGVIIRGKVTEDGSKAPVKRASVFFSPHSRVAADSSNGSGETETAADGSFELVVGPRAGHLAVHAANEDYVLQEIGSREFFQGEPGGWRLYAHSFTQCDPKPAGSGLELQVVIRRGVTISGSVVALDNQPVPDTWIIGRAAIRPRPGPWRMWRGDYHGSALKGRFELHAIDLESKVPVYFLQPERKLGATAQVSGKSAASGPLTIRLEACGTANARLVDANRRPLVRYSDASLISMVVTPGPDPSVREPAGASGLVTDSESLTKIDSINYAKPPESGPDGRITFAALIPGATYRIIDRTTIQGPSGAQLRKEFTVKTGEVLDLGDILIEKPQAR